MHDSVKNQSSQMAKNHFRLFVQLYPYQNNMACREQVNQFKNEVQVQGQYHSFCMDTSNG